MPARELAAEIMIEGEHAMDLRARQVERGGDHRDSRLRHIAEGFLQRVQDQQRRAFEVPMLRDDLVDALRIPWFVDWHHPHSLSATWRPLRSIGIAPKINKAVSCCDTETRSIWK